MMNRSFKNIISYTRNVYFHVKKPEAARRIAELVIQNENDSIIAPFSDYPGPLIREILSRKFRVLTICERDKSKLNSLQSHIREFYPDKNIYTHNEDLIGLSYKDSDQEIQTSISNIIKQNLINASSTNNNEKCDSPVKLLVPLMKSIHESYFLKKMYYQMCLGTGLCNLRHPHYYLIVSDRLYNYLSAEPTTNLVHYRWITVLSKTLMHITRLESFDLNDTYEIPLRDIQRTSRTKASSYKQVHLVLIKPKSEFIKNSDAHTWLEYRFFVSQIMGKRKVKLIKYLEKWFESCPQELEQFGITSKTIAGNLDPNEYLRLFLYFKSKPEYRSSTFLNAARQSEIHLQS